MKMMIRFSRLRKKTGSFSRMIPSMVLVCLTLGMINEARANVTQNCKWSTYSITFPAVNTLTEKNEPFQSFASTVSEQVLEKIAGSRWRRWWLTEVQPGQKSDIEIVFYGFEEELNAYATAFKYPDELLSQVASGEHSVGLTSPWVRLKLDQKERCHLRAVYVFNTRQFMMDQVNLAEGLPIANQIPVPFDYETYEKAIEEYQLWFESNTSELDGGIGNDPLIKNVVRRNASRRLLMAKMPPELVWLGEQSESSETIGSFVGGMFGAAVKRTGNRFTKAVTPFYVDLVVGLTNSFIASDEPYHRHVESYENIIETRWIIDRGKMKSIKINPGRLAPRAK
jgi:hypothetical protein